MSGATRPIPEGFEAFMAEKLEYLVSRELGEGYARRHNLELLRDLCRASGHGRLPESLRLRYEGVLRHLRPQVAAAVKAGDRIPAIIVEEIARAAAKRKPKRPGHTGAAATRSRDDNGEQTAN